MSQINILAVIPNPNDATSLYRGTGPLSQLRKSLDINIVFTDKVQEYTLDLIDIVFMQRPSEKNHLQLAELCNENRTPLWIDHDDLLFQVPEDNPAYASYSDPQRQETVRKIIERSDVVTVSTKFLKRAFQNPEAPLHKNVYVVPNALPDKFIHLAKPLTPKQQINWRGTDTHQRDLATYTKEFLELSEERKTLTLTFVGWNPWFITQYMEVSRAIVVQAMSINEYFKFMSMTNPPIQVVPLHSSLFNQCKSNIAWIESCLTGAVCIAPQWEEWSNRPGILTYQNEADFKACVEFALDNPETMIKQQQEGWHYIQDKLLISKVNPIREKLIKALVGTPKYKRVNPDDLPPGGEPLTSLAVKSSR